MIPPLPLQELPNMRSRTHQETLEAIWPLRAGAGISRVSETTQLDRIGIPVFQATRPFAERGNLTVSSGKSFSKLGAAVGAIMEAIERHYGEQGQRKYRVMSVQEARAAGPILDPNELLLDVRQGPLPKTHRTEWVTGLDVISGENVLLPADAVFTPYRPSGERLIQGNSDGLCAGNTLDEVLLHGLLELIERDARAFGEILGMGHRLDVESLPANLRNLVCHFDEAGIEIHFIRLFSTVPIPVVYAIGHDRYSRSGMLINGGASSALTLMEAAMGAILELAQTRVNVVSGSREDFSRRFGNRRREGYDTARLRYEHWVKAWSVQSYDNEQDFVADDIDQALEHVLAQLKIAGMGKVYSAVLTPEQCPITVGRVIVPGVEFAANEPYRLGPRFVQAAAKTGYFS